MRPGRDRQIVVGRLPGPEGPRRGARAGALRGRRARHPQRAPRCGADRAVPAARARSPRSSTRPSSTTTPASRRRYRPAGTPATTPGSPSRSAATTRARSASCRRCGAGRSAGRSTRSSGRSSALAADGVTEVTLLGQNVNSYGRDLTLAARQAGAGSIGSARCSPICSARSVPSPGIRRVRYTSPHPKDLRPDTVEAMAETRPCATTCTCRSRPARTGCSPRCTAGYTAERYLARLAAARQAIADLAVSTDLIVGFPGETEDDFAQTLEVVAAAEYDFAYTFIFSPRPGTEAATLTDRFVAPEVSSRAVRAAAGRRRALGAGPPSGPHRTDRGGAGRGSEQEGSRRSSAGAPGRTSSSTSVPTSRPGRAPTPWSRSPTPRRTTSPDGSSRSPPSRATGSGSRSPSGEPGARC